MEGIDLEAKTWTIPGERMKAGIEHTVPLSPAALELLKGLSRHEGTDFLFPSAKKTMLSDMTLSALVRGMNSGEAGPTWTDTKGQAIVVHGFRSSFRVWAAEATNIPREVAEHALAHETEGAVQTRPRPCPPVARCGRSSLPTKHFARTARPTHD